MCTHRSRPTLASRCGAGWSIVRPMSPLHPLCSHRTRRVQTPTRLAMGLARNASLKRIVSITFPLRRYGATCFLGPRPASSGAPTAAPCQTVNASVCPHVPKGRSGKRTGSAFHLLRLALAPMNTMLIPLAALLSVNVSLAGPPVPMGNARFPNVKTGMTLA
jgi:hypothetical protein